MADEGEDETCDQTQQIPQQVSLYYVALFVEEQYFLYKPLLQYIKEGNTI